MKKINKLVSSALLLACGTLSAEVYWLGPGAARSASGSRLPAVPFRELAEQRELMTEPAVYNGVRTEMRVSLLHQSLENLLAELRRRYPELKFKISSAGVLFTIRLSEKFQERVLLIGNSERVTAFSMKLPVPLPACPAWPAELPLPDGADPEELVRFPRRGTSYGAFRNAAPHALNRTADQAAGLGFAPVTGEAARSGGTGELFTNAATRELLTVTIAKDGTGTVIRSRTGR